MSEMKTGYTAEMEAELYDLYVAQGEDIPVLADHFGRSVRSVIAKLSQMGVYKAKTKAQPKAVTKADRVAAIAEMLRVSVEDIEDLAKAKVSSLSILEQAIVAATEFRAAQMGAAEVFEDVPL